MAASADIECHICGESFTGKGIIAHLKGCLSVKGIGDPRDGLLLWVTSEMTPHYLILQAAAQAGKNLDTQKWLGRVLDLGYQSLDQRGTPA